MIAKKLCLIILSVFVLMLPLPGVAAAQGAAMVADSFSSVIANYHATQVYISPAQWQDFASDGATTYISTDSGVSWSTLGFKQFNDLAFQPKNVFLISGTPPNSSGNLTYTSSLYTSADNGDDFNAVNPTSTGAAVPQILETAGTELLGNFNETLEASADGGQTWTNLPIYGVVPAKGCLAAIDENTYFAVMEDSSLKVTADGGQTWVDTNIKLDTAPMPARYSSGGFLYGQVAAVEGFAVALSPATSACLYISRNDGQSWNEIDSSGFVMSKGGQPETAYCAAVAPGGVAFVGTAHGVLVSDDYGQTWQPAAGSIFGEVTSIACSRSGKKLIVLASAEGLYRMEYNNPVVAPSRTSTSSLIKFVMGQDSYSVNGMVYGIDAAAFIDIFGRTQVPVQYLGDALGVQTTWDNNTKTVTLAKGKTTVELAIGSNTIIINGKAYTIEAVPEIQNGRTYLPALYVAQAFGYTVKWDATSNTVTINGQTASYRPRISSTVYKPVAAPAQKSAPKSNLIEFVPGQDSYSVNGTVYAVDAAAFIDNSGRALVPVQYLSDALGVQTTWDNNTKSVTLTKGKTTVKLAIGSKKIIISGKTQTIDSAPVIQNGRTYLPVNYIAKAFGYTVSWDDESDTVIIQIGQAAASKTG